MNHEIMRGNNYAAQICIDGYDSKILCGRLQSAALDSEMSFGSLMEFFCEMEQLLDQTLRAIFIVIEINERRTFRSVPSAPQQQSAMTRTPGRLATFIVRILFRQNASWQGSVVWVEGRQEERFRSALELVLLMDSALTAQK